MTKEVLKAAIKSLKYLNLSMAPFLDHASKIFVSVVLAFGIHFILFNLGICKELTLSGM